MNMAKLGTVSRLGNDFQTSKLFSNYNGMRETPYTLCVIGKHRHQALTLKSLRKFSDVASPMSSTETSRNLANSSATCLT